MLDSLKKLDINSRLLISGALLSLWSVFTVSPLFLALILVFPGVLIFKLSRNNWLETIPLMLMLNASIFIITAALAELLGLKINVTTLALMNLVTTSTVFLATKKRYLNKLNIELVDRKVIYIIYGLFLLAVISRVISTRIVKAPLLHDPISHAFWAKQIVTTQSINYFYPPGLHILIGFFAESLGLNYAIATHYVTNILSAFIVISWGLVGYQITKNKVFAILLSVLIFMSPYPTDLYFTAGKNSFLAALVFLPLALLCLYKFIKKPKPITAICLSISLLAVFFLHYAVFGYLAVFVATVCILVLFNRMRAKQALRPYFIYGLVAVVISGIVAGAWLVTTKTSYEQRTENRIVGSEAVESKPSKTSVKPTVAFKQTVKEFKATTDQHNSAYFPIIVICTCLILLIYTRSVYLLIPVFAGSVFLIPFVITLLGLKDVGIFRSTGMMLMIPIGTLAIAAVAACISDKFKFSRLQVLFAIVILIAVVPYSAYGTYKEYRKVSKNLSMVDSDDLEAFKWIDTNIDDKAIFLNNAVRSPVRKKIIFGTDAGIWLPVYTSNEVTMPFHEERFSSVWTHQNFDYYTTLGTDPIKSLCSLKAEGVNYYYQDSRTPYGTPTNVSAVVSKKNLQQVYENKSVKVFKITGLDEQCAR